MTNPLLEPIVKAFHDLELTVVGDRYFPESFGNAEVILAGRNVRVRVATDRGDLLVAVASCSEPENWYPLRQTVQVLLGVQIPADAPVDLLDASAILRTVLPGLEAHWAASDFQATKNAMEAAGIVGEADHQKRVRQYLEEKKRRDAGKQ